MEFADSNINFWVILRAQSWGDGWLVKHDFIKALLRRYKEEGIEISFPARSIFMRNGISQDQVAEGLQKGDTD